MVSAEPIAARCRPDGCALEPAPAAQRQNADEPAAVRVEAAAFAYVRIRDGGDARFAARPRAMANNKAALATPAEHGRVISFAKRKKTTPICVGLAARFHRFARHIAFAVSIFLPNPTAFEKHRLIVAF